MQPVAWSTDQGGNAMKEKARELGAKVKEHVQSAQKQLAGIEGEVQKVVSKVQEKIFATPLEGARKLDDLLRTIVATEFVEKVKAIEMFKQGQAVKKDILERFGLVSVEEVATLKQEIGQLKDKLAGLGKPAAKAEPQVAAPCAKTPCAPKKGGKKGRR
jgi:hypothetical protein